MPPTARMTSDEKGNARETYKRGFIPKHIADHLGRPRIDASRMDMWIHDLMSHYKTTQIPQILTNPDESWYTNQTNPTNPILCVD